MTLDDDKGGNLCPKFISSFWVFSKVIRITCACLACAHTPFEPRPVPGAGGGRGPAGAPGGGGGRGKRICVGE